MLPLVCAYTSTRGFRHIHGDMSTRVHTICLCHPELVTIRQKQEQLRTEEWKVGGGSPE